MPTVTFNLYDNFRLRQQNGLDIDLDLPGGNGLKMMLVLGTYTPLQNTHVFMSDLVPATHEVSGTGYAAGGNLCASPTVTLEGDGDVILDADDPATWAESVGGFTAARRAILYRDDVGGDALSVLIGFSNDFGSDQGNVDGTFDVDFDATEGYAKLPR